MSTTATPEPLRPGFEGIAPILRVRNVRASIDYYVGVLGFQVDWETPIFASVSRGGAHVFLSEGDQGHPGSWVWIGVTDAAALFEEYSRKGARIRHPPTNYAWAYEMQVEDIDGNVLRAGSEPLPGRPIGEWLDMHGGLWAMASSGEWTRVDRG
jgi:catechol 2,3-dioxygenase-like lactoylglutathione lyase family enzyme